MVDRRQIGAEEMRQPAGRHHRHRLAVFGLDALDQTADQPDIAPIDAGLHRGDGVAPDHLLGAVDGDARQQRRRLVQRLDGKIGARGNDAAAEGAVFGDDVEIGGGAEIDHDDGAGIACMRRHRVAEPVGADTLRPVDIGRRPQIERRIAHPHRLDFEVLAAEIA